MVNVFRAKLEGYKGLKCILSQGIKVYFEPNALLNISCMGQWVKVLGY